MWQKFTERARRVILLAQDEAWCLHSAHVGTEHILFGLLREDAGVAAQILMKGGITLNRVRREMGDQTISIDREPSPKLTKAAKRVLDLADDEARRMRHNTIDTGHLLLGLLREEEDLGATILRRLGLDFAKARSEALAHPGPQPEILSRTETRTPRTISPLVAVSTARTPFKADFFVTPDAMLLLCLAAIDAKKDGETLTSPKHLLLAIIEHSAGEAALLLQSLGLNLEEAKAALRHPPQTEPHQTD